MKIENRKLSAWCIVQNALQLQVHTIWHHVSPLKVILCDLLRNIYQNANHVRGREQCGSNSWGAWCNWVVFTHNIASKTEASKQVQACFLIKRKPSVRLSQNFDCSPLKRIWMPNNRNVSRAVKRNSAHSTTLSAWSVRWMGVWTVFVFSFCYFDQQTHFQ